ncbi:hypothetical protein SAMN04487970_11063 [Paenibacillus tianmuensis]|uniref:Uncharacterized protein n=1 Tax=Paenibacillus tianmuensis TaxID=624147 RepID=A0A1G4U2N6_9BACL|nr:hypothetical protein [Paenibacillus tianmuensis]SCW87933.1 hypothetical protein SAMN04487970_11063 [Paenibacillus tianmuensis]
MVTFEDKLFMFFLALLIVSLLVNGIGFSPSNWHKEDLNDFSGGFTDRHLARKQAEFKGQDRKAKSLFRSYLFWIAIVGIVVSIGLSYV